MFYLGKELIKYTCFSEYTMTEHSDEGAPHGECASQLVLEQTGTLVVDSFIF